LSKTAQVIVKFAREVKIQLQVIVLYCTIYICAF